MIPDPTQPSLETARQSLTDHVAAKGAEIRSKYGPRIGWQELKRILADRECVRYPCELVFDDSSLQTDEVAFPRPRGDKPEDGFDLCIHPYFAVDPSRVPLLAFYQLVAVNYGAFASPEDAEIFGAAVLGIPREDYYAALCEMADEISTAHLAGDAGPSGCACGTHGAEGGAMASDAHRSPSDAQMPKREGGIVPPC